MNNPAKEVGGDGRIFEITVDRGGARSVADNSAGHGQRAGEDWTWHHRELRHPYTERWLSESAGLDEIALQALLAEDARPRLLRRPTGIVVVLRGVNLNAGAEPEDMISVRIWCDAHRLITLRTPHLKTIQAVRDQIEAGSGPGSPGEALVEIVWGLTDRVSPVLERIDEETGDYEDRVSTRPVEDLRTGIAELKRRVIAIRRYLSPQRDALLMLSAEPAPWLTDMHRAHFRECADRVTRYVEDLDELRDREVVLHEELAGRLAQQLNRNMYLLSVLTGLFLPLGFLTGLLGINVGGIPGVHSDWAFVVVCVILLLVGVMVLLLFRRMRLLPSDGRQRGDPNQSRL